MLREFMLEPAFINQTELQKLYSSFISDKKSVYALPFPLRYQLLLDETNLYSIQIVSKNVQNQIIGYIEAQIDRYNNIVENVFLIKFCKDNSYIFTKDTLDFVSELFDTHGFEKIVFQTIIQNPANSIFSRFIKEKKVGRLIGVLKGHRKNIKGKNFDVALYEVYKTSWKRLLNKQETLLHKKNNDLEV